MKLKELSEAVTKQTALNHPNVPAHAVPPKKFSEKDSNSLQMAIEAYMKLKGHFARRLSSEGRFRPGEEYEDVLGKKHQLKGTWLPGLNTGMSDLFCCRNPDGKFIGIEVKFGKDRQSKGQIKFENDITKVGGLYIIVRNWADFIHQINEILA